MKKHNMILIIALLSISTSIKVDAQEDSCYAGVFIKFDDLKKNNLSHKINLNIMKNSLDFVPLSKILKISTKDSSIRFKPGTIYGYYKCGIMYRYSPDVELLSPEDYYQILEMSVVESDKMIIYSSVFLGGSELFYSIDLSGKIHRLNISNIERDFNEKYPEFVIKAKELASTIDGLAKKNEKGKYLMINFYERFVKN